MASHGRAPDRTRERMWRERVRRCRASGLSVREFCAAEGLHESAFYFWRRELAQRDRQRGGNVRPQFVPVHMTSEPAASAALEVVLRDGRTVRVGAGFDAEHLRAVVAALEATPC
jgi:transposase